MSPLTVSALGLRCWQRAQEKTEILAGMKPGWRPPGSRRQVRAQEDEKNILKKKVAMATLQIKQEAPGGKNSEEEGKVFKR